jgi:hypothetical protein
MRKQKPTQKLHKHGPVIAFLKGLLKLLVRRPEIIGAKLPDEPMILLANHKGAAGPLSLSLYFPQLFIPWGYYQMTESFPRRFDYLYRVFYRQKLGMNKAGSFILALLFGLVSKLIYNGMKVIPSYPDLRLRKTLRESFAHLEAGNNVLVFPEDSRSGYHDIASSYHGGFSLLAIEYYRKTGVDVPIVPVYFSKPKRLIVIGESESISSLLARGLNRKKITEHFHDIAEKMYLKHVSTEKTQAN